MFRFSLIFFSLLFYLVGAPLQAQNTVDDIPIYGLNPILYNGQVYTYFPGVGVKGHQYFEQVDFVSGSITIRGIKYENVLLNYDILNQEVVLKYTDIQGSNRLFMVSKAWLEKFSIGTEEFSILDASEAQNMIVQTLNKGAMQLHLYWTKRLIVDISYISKNYVFEKRKQTLFLVYKNNLQEFKSTKDILSLLPQEAHKNVVNYLRKNKIKARTNSLDQLIGLLNYCNQLDL